MCLIVYKPEGIKVNETFLSGIAAAYNGNRDGGGIVIKDKNKEGLFMFKNAKSSLEAFLNFLKPYLGDEEGVKCEIAYHGRIGTSGSRTMIGQNINCHPFIIGEHFNKSAGDNGGITTYNRNVGKPILMHNGIFRGWRVENFEMNDTYHVTKQLFEGLLMDGTLTDIARASSDLAFYDFEKDLLKNKLYDEGNKVLIMFPEKDLNTLLLDDWTVQDGIHFSHKAWNLKGYKNIGGKIVKDNEREDVLDYPLSGDEEYYSNGFWSQRDKNKSNNEINLFSVTKPKNFSISSTYCAYCDKTATDSCMMCYGYGSELVNENADEDTNIKIDNIVNDDKSFEEVILDKLGEKPNLSFGAFEKVFPEKKKESNLSSRVSDIKNRYIQKPKHSKSVNESSGFNTNDLNLNGILISNDNYKYLKFKACKDFKLKSITHEKDSYVRIANFNFYTPQEISSIEENCDIFYNSGWIGDNNVSMYRNQIEYPYTYTVMRGAFELFSKYNVSKSLTKKIDKALTIHSDKTFISINIAGTIREWDKDSLIAYLTIVTSYTDFLAEFELDLYRKERYKEVYYD
jgi:hypothetical protein